jgi:surfeit locus 1 family protein
MLCLSLVAACLAMAGLQLWRAQTKATVFALQQAQASAAPILLSPAQRDVQTLLWRPVLVRGVWLAPETLLLDNKVWQQRVGYQVLTALQLAGTKTVVLVNRGWVAAPRLRSELPVVSTPSGPVEVSGVARKFEEKYFEFGQAEPEGPVWQHVSWADYRQRTGLDALPVIVLQADDPAASPAPDGLVRDWSEVTTVINPAWRHEGYAVMWLIFALMAMVYGWLGWRPA